MRRGVEKKEGEREEKGRGGWGMGGVGVGGFGLGCCWVVLSFVFFVWSWLFLLGGG